MRVGRSRSTPKWDDLLKAARDLKAEDSALTAADLFHVAPRLALRAGNADRSLRDAYGRTRIKSRRDATKCSRARQCPVGEVENASPVRDGTIYFWGSKPCIRRRRAIS